MNSAIITAIAILANLLALYITYITATKKLEDNRSSKLNKIKRHGWIFIVYAIFLIIVQAAQAYLSDKANTENQNKRDAILYSRLKKSADSSVLIFKEKSDSSVLNFKKSSDSTALNIIGVLAFYKLKYDSAQKKIVTLIKDSSKMMVIQEETPTL